MNSIFSSQLRIKKRSLSECLIFFVILFPFIQSTITELLGIPDFVKFFIDACLVFLLAKLIFQRSLVLRERIVPFVVLIVGLFLYTLITYLFNYQSVFYYLWGLRNNFKFFVAFIAYVFFVDWDEAQGWLKFFDILYLINVFVIVIQFFGGYAQDYLGGIFGTQRGCNGSLLIFISIVVSKSVLLFMQGKEKTIKTVLITVSSLLVSALAELKIFFVVFIIIVIMAALFTKPTVQKTLFLFFGFFCTIAFSSLLSLLYSEFSDFLSFENLWNALANPNYATDEDIGRLTAIPVITNNFMSGISDIFFGLGLGNCDSSSVAIFNTPFYDAYYAYHYSYFSYAMWYIETGVIGLAGYASFYVISLVTAFKRLKAGTADALACQLAMITSVLCFILLVYNISLRLEITNIIFFVLAFPIISESSSRQSKNLEAL